MTQPISNEAVESAKKYLGRRVSRISTFDIDELSEIIQSAITKACAERDTQHRLDLSGIRRQHQQEADEWKTDEDLSAQLAVMKEALGNDLMACQKWIAHAEVNLPGNITLSEIGQRIDRMVAALSNLPADTRTGRESVYELRTMGQPRYYRENAHGYTTLAEAWQVTEEVGRKYVSGRPTDPDRVILEPAPKRIPCPRCGATAEELLKDRERLEAIIKNEWSVHCDDLGIDNEWAVRRRDGTSIARSRHGARSAIDTARKT